MPVDRSDDDAPREEAHGADEPARAGTPVAVRRHAGVAALVGYAASAVAIAYLWRASQTMTVLDWGLFVVLAAIAAVYLAALVDARTPLLVADDLGVRIRLGDEWRGLPWEAIGQVVVHPRRGLLRDGRLVFVPRSLARALDGLDVRARRHVALNQKMYGAALAVPLGSTTRVTRAGDARSDGRGASAPDTEASGSQAPGREAGSEAGSEAAGSRTAGSRTGRSTSRERGVARGIAEDIAVLARGRASVVVLDPRTLDVVDDRAPESQTADESAAAAETAPRAGLDGPDRGEVGPGEAEPGQSPDAVARAPRVRFPAAGVGETYDGAGAAVSATPEAFDDASRAERSAASGDETSVDLSVAAGAGAGQQAPRPQFRSILGGIGTIVSRVAKGRARDLDVRDAVPAHDLREEGPAEQGPDDHDAAHQPGTGTQVPDAHDPADRDRGPEGAAPTDGEDPSRPVRSTAPAALRRTRPGLRAEATLDHAPTLGAAALDPAHAAAHRSAPLPEGRELRRPGSVDLVFERVEVEDRVRPISAPGDAVEPLVLGDYVTEPAYDPVIGPELTAARTRLGLSVDDLAERTRIRPHVIESIEVDDFAPCGGDFYARGHLRTLARVLGKDVGPLLALFEERYATAPINARRVFEAELATGMTGSMRSTIGGPSWGLLIGVVLCLVLVWGVLRLITTGPAEVHAPVVNGAAVVLGGHAADLPSGIL